MSICKRVAGLALTAAVVVFAATVAVSAAARGAQPAAGGQSPGLGEAKAVVDQYCVTCHSSRLKSGGLVLEQIPVTNVAANAGTWEKIASKLRSGMMPPPGSPRPDEAKYQMVQGAIESALDRAAAAAPNPGRTPSFHRLSRAEYKNIVRDLLSLEVDVFGLLPQDDSSYGFDNIAAVLKVNQTSLERYLNAARKVSRLAVGISPPPTGAETFVVSPQQSQYGHVPGLPLGTRGGLAIDYNFPVSGEYDFAIKLQCTNTRGGDENCADGSTGFVVDQQMVLMIDGRVVQEFKFPANPRKDRYGADYGASVEETSFANQEKLQLRLAVSAGPHEVGVTFLRLPAVEVIQRTYRSTFDKPMTYRGVDRAMQMSVAHLSKVTISGPFNPVRATDTPSRRAIFVCRPTGASDEPACAKKIIGSLARRAYRRPVSSADVDKLFAFYSAERAEGGDFDAAIEDSLRALLASPEFWFRVVSDPPAVAPGAVYAISDLDLASRLSFFLWSSVPDDELLNIASSGRLRQPAVLDRQVRRMLADRRAKALTTNFAEQWLNLRRISVVVPNESDFPDFDVSLREAFAIETQMFVDNVIREDRSAMQLLDADFTFVNDRLAKHYGLPNVGGSRFRRVALAANSPHRGLLGQGSILTVTSHPTRTSPVKRGKWILEQILGSPPPPPPPNVPELKEKQSAGRVLTMRERMIEHRANPYCSGCHSMMDPVGFALENFDAIGRYRAADENLTPVDASGALPDGTKFSNVTEFRAALAKHPERFLLTLTEKLMTYALGRGMEPYDMPAVRKVVRNASANNYRFSSLVLGIVRSSPFQMRTAVGTPREAVTASLK